MARKANIVRAATNRKKATTVKQTAPIITGTTGQKTQTDIGATAGTTAG